MGQLKPSLLSTSAALPWIIRAISHLRKQLLSQPLVVVFGLAVLLARHAHELRGSLKGFGDGRPHLGDDRRHAGQDGRQGDVDDGQALIRPTAEGLSDDVLRDTIESRPDAPEDTPRAPFIHDSGLNSIVISVTLPDRSASWPTRQSS